MSNKHLMPQDPNGLLEDKTYPFSGKIKVGDWVRGYLRHNFIVGKPEWLGIVTYINPDDTILHVTDPVDKEDTRVIGMKWVIEHVPKEDK